MANQRNLTAKRPLTVDSNSSQLDKEVLARIAEVQHHLNSKKSELSDLSRKTAQKEQKLRGPVREILAMKQEKSLIENEKKILAESLEECEQKIERGRAEQTDIKTKLAELQMKELNLHKAKMQQFKDQMQEYLRCLDETCAESAQVYEISLI